MDLSIFKTDPDKEVQGVWKDIEFRGQTGKFKIARAGNPVFNRIFTRIKNSRTFVDDDSQSAKDHDDEALTHALAEAILMDTDEIELDGEVIDYTPELGYKILSDPAFSELKNQIAIAAGNFEHYAVVKLEALEKNS